MVLAVQAVDEGLGAELAVFRGHEHVGHLFHVHFVLLAIVLQRLDGHERQAMPPCQLDQLRRAHHRSVIGPDLAAQPARLKAGQPAQVHRCLSVPIALQHAEGLRHKGKHVARPAKVAGRRGGIHHFARRKAALGRRDARCRVRMIHRHGECRLVVVGVVGDHLGEAQAAAQLCAHRHADEPLSHARHEVHVLRRRELRGADEIALVLAIGVVGHQDDLSRAQVPQGLFNGVELEVVHDASLSLITLPCRCEPKTHGPQENPA